ncbi:MAG TPA: FAD-dependent oxidoreductase [Chloroflexota bacterium]|nr:FAD-dependent oxidoreductase [Chloroflexota bacterium]
MAEREKRFVIVGNGVAGTTCAETLRKNDPSCQITLIADERWPLYNRVALPPYIKEKVTREKVFLRTVEQHVERGIKLMVDTRAVAVDIEERTVRLDSGKKLGYDALLVATGGRPNPVKAPGAKGISGIFNFQYFDDAQAILEAEHHSKRAAVTGGSYIAYELAEAFRQQGLETYWLIRGPRFLRRVLDEEGGALVHDIAVDHGVHMLYNETVKEVVRSNGSLSGVKTAGGQSLDVQMLGAGLGMTMNLELLKDTPVETHDGILTNEYLETNVPGIYAAGDVAEFFDVTINRHNMMGTWGNSIGHGRVTALNMLGQRTVYNDIPMYSSTLFDSYIRVIGLTPENCPDLESVERLDSRNRSYQRLFFLEGRLVGACLIGDMRFRQKIFACIKSRDEIPVEERAHLLA